MDPCLETIVAQYRGGRITRRVFLERLIAVAGSFALARQALETWALAMPLLSPAPSASAGLESTAVKFPGEGATLEGYLSRPKGKGPYPGMILIHENRGLTDHIRDVARRLASEGCATLAVDLLSRKGGTASFATPDDATKAFQVVTDDEVIRDLDAASSYLNSHPAVRRDAIGVMGFCWGGERTFLYAAANPKLKAAVVIYGSPPPDDRLQHIQCPVLGNYGEKDTRITSTVPATEEKMKKLGKRYDAKIYPGAQHAFFNDTNPERYEVAAAKDAWPRVLAFLKKNLG